MPKFLYHKYCAKENAGPSFIGQANGSTLPNHKQDHTQNKHNHSAEHSTSPLYSLYSFLWAPLLLRVPNM